MQEAKLRRTSFSSTDQGKLQATATRPLCSECPLSDVRGSVGESNLRFSIDGVEKLNKAMVATDYTFRDDFVKQRMFSESNLDPNVNHTLRIQWTQTGVRPVVAVALDSIEYVSVFHLHFFVLSLTASTRGTLPKAAVSETPSTGSTSTSKNNNSSNIAKIVAPTVVAVVAVLALLGVLLRFYWVKRQRKRARARLIVDPSDTDHTSQMQLHAQSNWNATLYNRPGSMYLDQPYDSNSSMTAGLLGSTAATAGGVRGADPAFSPPPYADTDTSSSSISHPVGAPRPYPTPATKSHLTPAESGRP